MYNLTEVKRAPAEEVLKDLRSDSRHSSTEAGHKLVQKAKEAGLSLRDYLVLAVDPRQGEHREEFQGLNGYEASLALLDLPFARRLPDAQQARQRRCKVRHAAPRAVHARSPQRLGVDVLVHHGLDHLGPREEHVAVVLHHHGEVRQRRRVGRAAGARTHDRRDLRDDARGIRIQFEDVRVSPE